jgi:NodT family efflux transporter outer membrane factor (OMF) lipoprotein
MLRLILLLTLSVMGCTVIPVSTPDVVMPKAWQAMPVANTVSAAIWWQQFNQPELIRLIDLAHTQNQPWQAALQRIAQARAVLQSKRAAIWPQLSVRAGASGNQNRANHQSTTTHNSDVGVSLSYEVDIWGRLAATSHAAREQLRASEYAAASIKLLLDTDVAAMYFQLCALTDRLRLNEKNYALAQNVLQRLNKAQSIGAVAELSLITQRQLLATMAATIETLKAQVATTRSALAILVGMAPQNFQVVLAPLHQLPRPIPQVLQPAALLTRRPDILQAEANLLAANADVIAARAAFFPSIKLSTSGLIRGLMSGGSAFVSTWIADLTTPLFNGGKLRADLLMTTARREELTALYRQAVLQALKEGEDALHLLQHQQNRETHLQIALHNAQAAYQLSQGQYKVGDIDYLTLLEAQRTLIVSEDNYVQAQYDTLVSILTLYKALGGAPALTG